MINETGFEGITDPSLIYSTRALVIVTLIGIISTAILTKFLLNETKKSSDLYTVSKN